MRIEQRDTIKPQCLQPFSAGRKLNDRRADCVPGDNTGSSNKHGVGKLENGRIVEEPRLEGTSRDQLLRPDGW